MFNSTPVAGGGGDGEDAPASEEENEDDEEVVLLLLLLLLLLAWRSPGARRAGTLRRNDDRARHRRGNGAACLSISNIVANFRENLIQFENLYTASWVRYSDVFASAARSSCTPR